MLHVLLVALIGGNIPLTPAAWQEDCDHEAMRTLNVAVAPGTRLDLLAHAGSLRIEGKRGGKDVRVRARACAARESRLDELKLVSRNTGGVLRIEATQPDNTVMGGSNDYAYMDLVVEVPLGMKAHIEDGSGSAFVAGLGDVDIEDGSGELRIENLAGGLRVNDGSGELHIRTVRGDVILEDGSGDASIRDVSGRVHVTSDGSGDLDIDQAGALTVDQAGSGRLSYRRVQGRVIVPQRHRH